MTEIKRSELLDKILASTANPASILQTTVDVMEEIYGGSELFVDPTNPAVSLLETIACTGAASVIQHTAALRKLYPSLAQTPEDLYRHMSYRHYVDRFASPSTDPFFLFVPLSQFMSRMVKVPGTNYSKITIPRGTTVRVNDYAVFTLQYPIDLRYYDTQSLEVAFNTKVTSPLQALSTNVITPEIVKDPDSMETWIRFEVDLVQVHVKKVTDNVQAGRYFVQTYDFLDQFCMARAYHRSNATGRWVEMQTTHSPVVYDPRVPTMAFKVIDDTVTATLPLVYQNQGLVEGEIRVDILTSKGAEIIDMEQYDADKFIVNMATLDEIEDTDEYTAAASQVSVYARSTSVMSGGKNALSFEELRNRVINDSFGLRNIPITNVDVGEAAKNNGFELVSYVDTITNRVFLATKRLPSPTNPRLVTGANIGIATLITDGPSTINHPWIKRHGQRTTLLPANLYRAVNSVLELLPYSEVLALKNAPPTTLLPTVNDTQYLYTPFYYVLDTSREEMKVRTYHLDKPQALSLSFVEQNTSIQLVVNTTTYGIVKYSKGYKLQVQTKSGSHYKRLQDNEVQCQLGVKLQGTDRMAYWLGTLVGKTENEERIFEFDLQTSFDVTDEHMLVIDNAKIDSTSSAPVEVALNTAMTIFHTTTSLTPLYVQSSMDEMIGRFQLSPGSAAITQERVIVQFGVSLNGLWNRGRTVPDTDIYERYQQDVYAVYEEDVLGTPAVTVVNGTPKYNYVARKGDTIYDGQGKPRILHAKGDVVFLGGVPVVSDSRIGAREIDMLMVDGRHYFVNDPAYIAYNDEFVKIIVDWITGDISTLQDRALENTQIYFYPKNQLTLATILVADFTEDRIESGQSLVVDLHVSDEVYRNADRRQRIISSGIAYLDKWISGTRISVSDAESGLRDLYGDSCYAVRVSGVGGSRDYRMVTLSHEENRMSLKRILDIQLDGTYIIREDVTFNFIKAIPAAADK